MKLRKHKKRQSTVQQNCRAIVSEGVLIHTQCDRILSKHPVVWSQLGIKIIISNSTSNNSNVIQTVENIYDETSRLYQVLPFLLLIVI